MTKLLRLRHCLFIFLISAISLLSNISNVSAACNVPLGIYTTSITTTSAILNWAPTVADSFLLRYNVTGTNSFKFRMIKPGTAINTTVTGLYPNTSYSWVIHTYCSGGVSGLYQSTPAQFTTSAGTVPCVIPNNTESNSIGPFSAVISWNPTVSADSFLIRYVPRNTSNYAWQKILGSNHSLTLTNLAQNTIYDWWVRSVCASNPAQSYGSMNSFTTLSSSCGIADPYFFLVTNIGYNSAICSWRVVTGAVSYNIRYSVRYSNVWTTLSSTTNTKGLSGLLSNTTYEFQIQTICTSGAGPWTTSRLFQTTTSTLALTRGPYLQQSTESSIFIRWRTGIPSDARVKYGTSSSNLNMTADNLIFTTEHIVQLTGLSSNTKYFYSIGSTGTTLQSDTGNYFTTNPPVGSTGPVRIWTIGDFGVASAGQRAVRDAYSNFAGSANTNIWLWVGDNAYSDGTDVEYTNNVFSIYPYQMKKWVIWPATGNHDLHSANATSQTGPYFDNFTLPKAGEVGGVPSNTEAYYSFNYANIHFVCLESTDAAFRATNGAMATWLVNDLDANSQRWTIVYFHHPPYSKGSHDSDVDIEMVQMRSNIIPILENKKVDLVLTGHSHSYERSMMLKGHFGQEASFNAATMAVNSGSGIFPTPYVKSSPSYSGTVYVVCGVSGQIGATTSGWPHNAMYSSSIASFGSLVLDIVGDRLDCKFLTSTGSIFDQFTIQKNGTPLQKIAHESMDPAVPAGDPLQIFPNPLLFQSTIRYVLENNSPVRMEITDMTGRVVYMIMNEEHEKGEYEIKLNKSDVVLPGGIYFLRMIAGERSYLKKFVVND